MPALATSLSVSGSAGTFRSMLYSIQATTGERWLSVDPNTRADAIDAVGDIPSAEFRKIFDALSTSTIRPSYPASKRRRSSSTASRRPRWSSDRADRSPRPSPTARNSNSRSRAISSTRTGRERSTRRRPTFSRNSPLRRRSLPVRDRFERTASVNRSHGYSVSRSRHRSLSGVTHQHSRESRLAAQHNLAIPGRQRPWYALAASAGHSNDTPTQNQINE